MLEAFPTGGRACFLRTTPPQGDPGGRSLTRLGLFSRKGCRGEKERERRQLSGRELLNIIMKNWVYLGFVSLKNNTGEQ